MIFGQLSVVSPVWRREPAKPDKGVGYEKVGYASNIDGFPDYGRGCLRARLLRLRGSGAISGVLDLTEVTARPGRLRPVRPAIRSPSRLRPTIQVSSTDNKRSADMASKRHKDTVSSTDNNTDSKRHKDTDNNTASLRVVMANSNPTRIRRLPELSGLWRLRRRPVRTVSGIRSRSCSAHDSYSAAIRTSAHPDRAGPVLHGSAPNLLQHSYREQKHSIIGVRYPVKWNKAPAAKFIGMAGNR